MKKIGFVVFVLIVILVGLYFSFKGGGQAVVATPTPVANSFPLNTPAYYTFCGLNDLNAFVQIEGAAGSVYGDLAIQNISAKECQIKGINFIQPVFDATNITVAMQGKPSEEVITLKPKETVYSRVKYPNGPQCSGGVEEKEVSFMYRISSTETILFHAENEDTLVKVNACKAESEKTEIQVWGLASNPSVFDTK